MKLIPDTLETWATQHPLKMILGCSAFLCLVALYGSRVDWLKSQFDHFVRAGTRVVQGSQIDVDTWFFVVYALALIFAITGGALVGRGMQGAEAQSSKKGLKLVQRCVDAAATIKDRSFPEVEGIPLRTEAC